MDENRASFLYIVKVVEGLRDYIVPSRRRDKTAKEEMQEAVAPEKSPSSLPGLGTR
jgi:hypothetical protein